MIGGGYFCSSRWHKLFSQRGTRARIPRATTERDVFLRRLIGPPAQLIAWPANNFIATASAVPWKPIERAISNRCVQRSGTDLLHYARCLPVAVSGVDRWRMIARGVTRLVLAVRHVKVAAFRRDRSIRMHVPTYVCMYACACTRAYADPIAAMLASIAKNVPGSYRGVKFAGLRKHRAEFLSIRGCRYRDSGNAVHFPAAGSACSYFSFQCY